MRGAQARNIVRHAKKNGISMMRGKDHRCARSVLAHMYGLTYIDWDGLKCGDTYNKHLPAKSGLTLEDVSALEAGFEGGNYHIYYAERGGYRGTLKDLKKNRYYEVGKNVARLAGLPFYSCCSW